MEKYYTTYPYGDIYRTYTLGGYADQKYDFTGKERDVETGLHYFGARYYDSDLGRWLQVDPLADKYPGWSPYNYCVNNPVRLVDPDGRLPKERQAAIKYAQEQEAKKVTYKQMDCSNLVNEALKAAGLKNQNYGNENGVGNIAKNSRKVDKNEIREGDLVTFRTNRSDHKGKNGEYDHIGIIISVKIVDDKVTEFDYIHSSTSKGVSKATYNEDKYWNTATGFYQWDTFGVVPISGVEPVIVGEKPSDKMDKEEKDSSKEYDETKTK